MSAIATAMVSRNSALRLGARFLATVGIAFMFGAIGGCGGTYEKDVGKDVDREERLDRHGQTVDGSLFGDDGILLFGRSKKAGPVGSPIGVNSFLWRASLDTLSFMPLSSADPFGGVIITDWYVPPETPNHRFKANIYILDRQLRADGIRISLFHQRLNGAKQWVSVATNKKTMTDLEDAILTRARQLRIGTAN